ncbi:hypothetical protein ACQCSX_20985 (plasmid) [Pseudarthrobacter sp. P1]|uniref:hypothetical protein n=1 Tax=Pseudarthrobacter sp. P1 TaxID=3418418 RepID=UPI003CF0AE2C
MPDSMRAVAIPGQIYLHIADPKATSTVTLISATDTSDSLPLAKITEAFEEKSPAT